MTKKQLLEDRIKTDPRKVQHDRLGETSIPAWDNALNDLFIDPMPSFFEWTDIHNICEVLNTIGNFKTSNHIFFKSGGLDLSNTSSVVGNKFIILGCDMSKCLIEPVRLTFRNINNDPEWCYFRLECNTINSQNLLDPKTNPYYYDLYDFDNQCLRYNVDSGTFLIFRKASSVNFYIHDYCGNLNQLSEYDLKTLLEEFVI